jgi:hypothetical protein
MAKCLNCNKSLSCGCQKKTASDGKSVCATCVVAYESKLKLQSRASTPNSVNK